MEPEELAHEVRNVMQRAMSRVGPGSIGAEQYHTKGEPQKFETATLAQFCQMYLEEFEDIINYAVMAHIRVRRLFADLEQIEEILNASGGDQSGETADGIQREVKPPSGATSFTPTGKVL